MSSWRCIAAMVVGGWIGTSSLYGQDGSPAQAPAVKPEASQGERQGDKPSPTVEAVPGTTGKVLFSRSLDDKTTTSDGRPDPGGKGLGTQISLSQASDAELSSLTFLAYNLDIRLVPRQQSLAVKAKMTARNDGEKPLQRIALQLSSQLKWEQVRANGAALPYTHHLVDSDADHSGAVNEAIVTLPHELAPKDEFVLEVLYSGQIAISGARLERIGAPTPVAEKSDWDQISSDFIGLRGFGNVVWYPVSAPPALLGDGAKLFAEIGRQKLRQSQAKVSMTVTAEFTADTLAPNLAVMNGHVVPVVQTATPENSYPGVVTAALPETSLGFAVPSLFLLARQRVESNGLQTFVTADDLVSAQSLTTAVNVVTPLVQQWLGAKPKSRLTVVGLPDAEDASSEEGAVFLTGLKAPPDPRALEDAMIHSLTHAYFRSPRAWLQEGVPQFLGSLWIEQVQGRQTALESLAAGRGALALAEPGTPGETGGEELTRASNSVYYRTKAAYVLWMLRDLAGDAELGTALRAYVPEQDTMPEYFERLVEKSSGKELKWFFDAWVYHDRGLPDLSITGVFPSKAAAAGQWLVALDISNDGFAEAEVPVTLRTKDTTVTERLRIPGRGKVSRRMLIEGLPTEVQVNDGTVPEIEDSLHVRKLTVEAP